jgi:hypothetical protein
MPALSEAAGSELLAMAASKPEVLGERRAAPRRQACSRLIEVVK